MENQALWLAMWSQRVIVDSNCMEDTPRSSILTKRPIKMDES